MFLLFRLRLLRESVLSFTTVLELDPLSPDALIGRGNAFMDFGHGIGYENAR